MVPIKIFCTVFNLSILAETIIHLSCLYNINIRCMAASPLTEELFCITQTLRLHIVLVLPILPKSLSAQKGCQECDLLVLLVSALQVITDQVSLLNGQTPRALSPVFRTERQQCATSFCLKLPLVACRKLHDCSSKSVPDCMFIHKFELHRKVQFFWLPNLCQSSFYETAKPFQSHEMLCIICCWDCHIFCI